MLVSHGLVLSMAVVRPHELSELGIYLDVGSREDQDGGFSKASPGWDH